MVRSGVTDHDAGTVGGHVLSREGPCDRTKSYACLLTVLGLPEMRSQFNQLRLLEREHLMRWYLGDEYPIFGLRRIT